MKVDLSKMTLDELRQEVYNIVGLESAVHAQHTSMSGYAAMQVILMVPGQMKAFESSYVIGHPNESSARAMTYMQIIQVAQNIMTLH